MTIAEAKGKLVAWCNGQIGYVEGTNNYNKYADKWTQAGGWNAQNQPWCDIFVDCCFIECFGIDYASRLTYQPKGGFSALCSASANYYKANGAWFSTPDIGDQVFFNVSGGINHTGIVVGVSGGIVTCVEGNSSDAVCRNPYVVSSSYIAGFGRPNWSIFSENSAPSGTIGEDPKPSAPSAPVQKTCNVSVTFPVLQYGDKDASKGGNIEGDYVSLMQRRLILKGYSCGWWGADGEYGQQTKIGLFEFQKKNGLETDCVCGKETWSKLIGI